MKSKIKNLVVGSVIGALTGGIGGYLYGAKKEREALAQEPVEVLESEVVDAALEAAADTAEQAVEKA